MGGMRGWQGGGDVWQDAAALWAARTTAGVNAPPPDFAGLLRSARLSQAEFRELVLRLAGQRIAQTTTSRWVKGTRAPPPCALALLGLVARIPPAELDRLLGD